MSIQYKAILCYGIELTSERENTYIKEVGEKRWEEIHGDFFIAADAFSGNTLHGILGIQVADIDEGEYISLGDGYAITRSISSDIYNKFRDVMCEVKEFQARPQIYLICQVS